MKFSSEHKFNPEILREYDIRGIYSKILFDQDAYTVGRTFGKRILENGGTKVAVARDGRMSGPALVNALKEGLLDAGVNVIFVGIGPTPMLYFSEKETGADAAVMVTGSHNPADYNGFKMVLAGKPFFGEDIKGLANISVGPVTKRGTEIQKDISDAYVARLLRDIKIDKKLSVVWDSGNSSAGEILKKLLAKLPTKNELIFGEIDGTFPNHHPDPTVEKNLAQLKAEVLAKKADLGVAFDGDADRLGVVDNEGRVLWGDQILAFLARGVLKDHKGATIIADVKTSQSLFDDVKNSGGTPLMWKTGHSLIKTKMRETKAPLAGEMSGHIFFADKWDGFDDGIYAALRFIEMASQQDVPLSELRKSLPESVSTPELRFETEESVKLAVIERVKERLVAEGADFDPIDGVRVKEKDGWWLLRASNTQAVLVGRVEAENQEALIRIKEKFGSYLKDAGLNPDWDNAS